MKYPTTKKYKTQDIGTVLFVSKAAIINWTYLGVSNQIESLDFQIELSH